MEYPEKLDDAIIRMKEADRFDKWFAQSPDTNTAYLFPVGIAIPYPDYFPYSHGLFRHKEKLYCPIEAKVLVVHWGDTWRCHDCKEALDGKTLRDFFHGCMVRRIAG